MVALESTIMIAVRTCVLSKNIKRDVLNHLGMLLIPVQLMPSPEKPGLHEQLKDPSVLLHMAFPLQLSIFIAHSSISKSKW